MSRRAGVESLGPVEGGQRRGLGPRPQNVHRQVAIVAVLGDQETVDAHQEQALGARRRRHPQLVAGPAEGLAQADAPVAVDEEHRLAAVHVPGGLGPALGAHVVPAPLGHEAAALVVPAADITAVEQRLVALHRRHQGGLVPVALAAEERPELLPSHGRRSNRPEHDGVHPAFLRQRQTDPPRPLRDLAGGQEPLPAAQRGLGDAQGAQGPAIENQAVLAMQSDGQAQVVPVVRQVAHQKIVQLVPQTLRGEQVVERHEAHALVHPAAGHVVQIPLHQRGWMRRDALVGLAAVVHPHPPVQHPLGVERFVGHHDVGDLDVGAPGPVRLQQRRQRLPLALRRPPAEQLQLGGAGDGIVGPLARRQRDQQRPAQPSHATPWHRARR